MADGDDLIAGMDPEGLRRTLGELLASNRKTQDNLDEIRQQFPIQPSNLADEIPNWAELEDGGLEPPEEGEGEGEFLDQLLPIEAHGDLIAGDEDGNADVLPVGQDGQVLTANSGSPLGMDWATAASGGGSGETSQIEIVKLTAPPGAGTTLQFLVPQTFVPTTIYLFATASGPYSSAIPISAAIYSRVTLSGSGEGTGARPCIAQYMTTGTGSLLGNGPGPRLLRVTRNAEHNAKNETILVLALIASANHIGRSGGSSGTTEVNGVLQVESNSITLNTEFIPAIYTRADPALPTDRVGTKIAELQVEYAEGETGTAGAQLFFPTIVERESELAEEEKLKQLMSWTFPNEGIAQRAIYATRGEL